MILKGEDGLGKPLTEDDIMFSVKTFCNSCKKEEDYEMLAREVDFDLVKAAQAHVNKRDPKQMVISVHTKDSYEGQRKDFLPQEAK